jgi:hypothetical protein
MSDPVLLEDEYLHAAEVLRINASIRKGLDAEDARCKEILAKVLAEGEQGMSPDGEILVQIKPGARVWNEDTARTALADTPELLQLITVTETVTRLDKQKAKNLFGDDLYATCCKANRASVVPL